MVVAFAGPLHEPHLGAPPKRHRKASLKAAHVVPCVPRDVEALPGPEHGLPARRPSKARKVRGGVGRVHVDLTTTTTTKKKVRRQKKVTGGKDQVCVRVVCVCVYLVWPARAKKRAHHRPGCCCTGRRGAGRRGASAWRPRAESTCGPPPFHRWVGTGTKLGVC